MSGANVLGAKHYFCHVQIWNLAVPGTRNAPKLLVFAEIVANLLTKHRL